MKNKYFSVLPIGGVEEIGSNMTVIRTPSEDIIIDCGMLFPFEECFDINYLIPDFSSLDPARVKSIVITHGHEDHIGALGHFLKTFPDVKVYISKFTLHLVQRKLEEFKVKMDFKLYTPQDDLLFDDVEISPVHVNHSIPETCGMIVRTRDKSWGALYISDFKVDLSSEHEAPIDFKRIHDKLTECKQTAYFIDSTNVMYDGKTTSENELLTDLKSLMERKEERIFITLFASNVHRMNTIALMGKAAGRKLVIMGRSLRTYMEAAYETGHSGLSPEEIHLPDQVKGQKGKMLVFLSGCQGDFMSALRRFSFGEDGTFKPGPGDLVVFSSKVIPGNEKKIFRIYNKLSEFGVEIITGSDHLIHASGHPGKEDLHLLMKNFTPNFYFPIHGESYMLQKHVEFIQQSYPKVSTHLIYNYQEVVLGDGTIKIVDHEAKEPLLIHGNGHVIEKTQISQRRKLATQGAVFISYHKTQGHIEVTTLGLPLMAQDLLENLKKKLLQQIKNDLSTREEGYFKDQVKISTRQFFNNFLGYKPMTEVHLY
ncbi:MAG TPA: ribonuclease J [Bacteriovoracaceae bacterium]|nr:ribonuclease J [Bacteriovoracaceae bacterium]